MDQKAFVKAALEGKPVVLVEYRSFKPDKISYRDKKTGQAIEQLIVKHGVEMGELQVQVAEWMPQGTTEAQVKPPFAKGAKAVLLIEGMTQEQGFFKAKGQLFPYEG